MTVAAPIRLVFCITELDPGGAERALAQLVMNLNRNEWEPHVICLGPRGYFADVLESANIHVLCLNAKGVFSLPHILLRLTQELRRLRPSLVQTFLFHANLIGRIAARLAGVRLVVSGLRVAEHRSSWYGRFDRWTNSLVATNVCVSQGVADFAENKTGIPRSKLVVIPNSVDVERFAHAKAADLTEFRIPTGSRVFISIGRLERQKGIDVLLDAIALFGAASRSNNASSLQMVGLDPLPGDVHFLIVGEGPDLSRLQERAERIRISERVHFAGRRDDVPELLAASMTLILPSRWEGMPNVVLEAMAAARPVIATNVEGIAELVKDRVTGITVPVEDPTLLAEAIQGILADSEFVLSAGRVSQDIAVKYFTTDFSAASYASLYRRLLTTE